MSAYYNEIDRQKAAWLRELVAQNLIAPGDVDERSIHDVRPDDLRGYTQCHFFAGIGAWSYALRLAGWPDEREVWTGSCPCQPFSSAGKRKAFDDERHLWPSLFRLIEARRPVVCFGEQVASVDGLAWLDAVQADLDGAGYACGAVDLCAAGFGAPHRRQRLFFVAHAEGIGRDARRPSQAEGRPGEPERLCDIGVMADPDSQRREEQRVHVLPGEPREAGAETAGRGSTGSMAYSDGIGRRKRRPESTRQQKRPDPAEPIASGGMADAERGATERYGLEVGSATCGNSSEASQRERLWPNPGDGGESGWMGDLHQPRSQGSCRELGPGTCECVAGAPGPVNGFWRDADWVLARPARAGDGPSFRPVEPGIFPLVDRAPARVGRLRGYGDSIVVQAAQGFIEAYMAIANDNAAQEAAR